MKSKTQFVHEYFVFYLVVLVCTVVLFIGNFRYSFDIVMYLHIECTALHVLRHLLNQCADARQKGISATQAQKSRSKQNMTVWPRIMCSYIRV